MNATYRGDAVTNPKCKRLAQYFVKKHYAKKYPDAGAEEVKSLSGKIQLAIDKWFAVRQVEIK